MGNINHLLSKLDENIVDELVATKVMAKMSDYEWDENSWNADAQRYNDEKFNIIIHKKKMPFSSEYLKYYWFEYWFNYKGFGERSFIYTIKDLSLPIEYIDNVDDEWKIIYDSAFSSVEETVQQLRELL